MDKSQSELNNISSFGTNYENSITYQPKRKRQSIHVSLEDPILYSKNEKNLMEDGKYCSTILHHDEQLSPKFSVETSKNNIEDTLNPNSLLLKTIYDSIIDIPSYTCVSQQQQQQLETLNMNNSINKNMMTDTNSMNITKNTNSFNKLSSLSDTIHSNNSSFQLQPFESKKSNYSHSSVLNPIRLNNNNIIEDNEINSSFSIQSLESSEDEETQLLNREHKSSSRSIDLRLSSDLHNKDIHSLSGNITNQAIPLDSLLSTTLQTQNNNNIDDDDDLSIPLLEDSDSSIDSLLNYTKGYKIQNEHQYLNENKHNLYVKNQFNVHTNHLEIPKNSFIDSKQQTKMNSTSFFEKQNLTYPLEQNPSITYKEMKTNECVHSNVYPLYDTLFSMVRHTIEHHISLLTDTQYISTKLPLYSYIDLFIKYLRDQNVNLQANTIEFKSNDDISSFSGNINTQTNNNFNNRSNNSMINQSINPNSSMNINTNINTNINNNTYINTNINNNINNNSISSTIDISSKNKKNDSSTEYTSLPKVQYINTTDLTTSYSPQSLKKSYNRTSYSSSGIQIYDSCTEYSGNQYNPIIPLNQSNLYTNSFIEPSKETILSTGLSQESNSYNQSDIHKSIHNPSLSISIQTISKDTDSYTEK